MAVAAAAATAVAAATAQGLINKCELSTVGREERRAAAATATGSSSSLVTELSDLNFTNACVCVCGLKIDSSQAAHLAPRLFRWSYYVPQQKKEEFVIGDKFTEGRGMMRIIVK